MSLMIAGFVFFLGIPLVPDWKHDLMAIAGALIVSCLVMRFHPFIFGTGPLI